MKKLTKVLSMVMVAVMLIGMLSITAFAAGDGTITITNASKNITYTIVRLFDATVDSNGNIAYTGTIPTELEAYFEYIPDTVNNIRAKDAALSGSDMSPDAIAAMKAWAEKQNDTNIVTTQVAQGGALVFNNLPFGYYVVISSQGAAVSIDSTRPDAEIRDKNSTVVKVGKTVDDKDVYFGQTVTYTVTVDTANWVYPLIDDPDNEGQKIQDTTKDPEWVSEYIIHDTLPDFLKDVKVTSLVIDQTPAIDNDPENTVTLDVTNYQFDTNKQIYIDWYNEDENAHYYNNGSQIIITYTAVVNTTAQIDGEGNKNTVTVTVETENDDENYWEQFQDDEVIWTYALAIQKVDATDRSTLLPGAKFRIQGLTVDGDKGVYNYVSYDSDAEATSGSELVTDDFGNLVIKGLPSDLQMKLVEIQAPDGYILSTVVHDVQAKVVGTYVTASSTKIYYDADGNVTQTDTETFKFEADWSDNLTPYVYSITNAKGTELPETGGMGTTMFILIGYMVALMSAVVLVARKKAAGYR